MEKGRKIHAIPRQTIFRFLKSRPKIYEQAEARENTPKTLYIMADEKWIPLQDHDADGNKMKRMTKAAVVFEDVAADPSQKNRHKLVNRYVFFNNEGNFWRSLYSRLCEMYDMNNVKRIWIMGDGAGWIKSGRYELGSDTTKTSFALDKFHFGRQFEGYQMTVILRKCSVHGFSKKIVEKASKMRWMPLLKKSLKEGKRSSRTGITY